MAKDSTSNSMKKEYINFKNVKKTKRFGHVRDYVEEQTDYIMSCFIR